MKREDFEGYGSLITYGDGNCLGYLLDFQDKGVFDASFGKVPVTVDESAKHNEALDKALLEGLDNHCEIGQYGTFYFDWTNMHVNTFTGKLVAEATLRGEVITFVRGGKTFRGRRKKEMDCFNFKRIK